MRIGALCVAGILAALIAGCGPHSLRQATCFDPTDDCNWTVVVVRNDTARTATLMPCQRCGPADREAAIIIPSGRMSPKTQYGSVRAYTGMLNWWAVQDDTGRTLGCLLLDGHPDKQDGDIVFVSEAGPCRNHAPPTRTVGRIPVQSP